MRRAQEGVIYAVRRQEHWMDTVDGKTEASVLLLRRDGTQVME